MPMARCARKSPSSAICAQATTIRPVCKPARPAQLSVYNPPLSSAQPKKFCGGEHTRKRRTIAWPLQQNHHHHKHVQCGVSGKQPSPQPSGSGSQSQSSCMLVSTPGTSSPCEHSHLQDLLLIHCAFLASSPLSWSWAQPPTRCAAASCEACLAWYATGSGCTPG